ncbi:MAG: hypothetical protein HQ453_03305 [Actinobacteria bacterium]|nr:hypothetical protein [Actinomycetota bacterium]
MTVLVRGSVDARRGMILAMRLTATCRGTRPFEGSQAALVIAMAGVCEHGHEGQEAADFSELIGREEPCRDAEAAMAEIARCLTGPSDRRDASHCALIVALAADEPDASSLESARWIARGLGADDLTMRDVEASAHANAARAEADLFRRFLVWRTGAREDLIRERLAAGLPAVPTPPESVERLRRLLGEAQDGTVGGELARFYAQTGYDLPGSPGTLPLEVLGGHDVHHILAGYDASAEDEVYLAGFEAANATDGGADYLAVIMLQWHQGIKVGVFPPDHAPLNPTAFAKAVERGSQTTVDLSDRSWDWQSLLAVPLDDARAVLGIPPGGSVAPGGTWDARHHWPAGAR